MARGDPDPKALACYGLLVRPGTDAPEAHLAALRGWPARQRGHHAVPGVVQRSDWRRRASTTLVLVWDNASWHVSGEVRRLAARAQPAGPSRRRGAPRALLPADQEPVAQSHRTQVGAMANGASSNPLAC